MPGKPQDQLRLLLGSRAPCDKKAPCCLRNSAGDKKAQYAAAQARLKKEANKRAAAEKALK